MKKNILIWIYLIFILTIWFFISNKYHNLSKNIDKQLSWSIIFSWDTFSGEKEMPNLIDTWNLVDDKSEYDKFQSMMNNWFIRKYNPPQQPQLTSTMTYSEKSNSLNDYLKNNNFYFRTTDNLSDGYIYFKLSKSLKSEWDVFVYFHNVIINWYAVSGKLIKGKNLIQWSTSEFLYKIDSIWIKKFYWWSTYKFDWLKNELNNNDSLHFIGGYTTTSDWNYIKEIIIVWK
jgi:hypothetical protein